MPDMTAVWPTDQSPGNVSSEARWRKMSRLWVPSGVDSSPLVAGGATGGLAPTLVAGPTINVAAGACWVDGHYCELANATAIPATANGLLVVRFTPADGRAQLVYVDAATIPTRTAATWELAIARMSAGTLGDRRVFANGSVPTAVNFPAVQVNMTPALVVDGFEVVTLDDGRTWTFRAASFTPNAIVGALPANRWETRVQMMNPGAATDSGGIGTIPASAFGLDGLIAINGAGGWAASAFPQLALASMRWSSQSAGQIRLYTISGSPSGTVAFYASQSNVTLLLDAYGYRIG